LRHTLVAYVGKRRRFSRTLGLGISFHLGLERSESLHHGAVIVSHDDNYGMIRWNVAALDLVRAGGFLALGCSGGPAAAPASVGCAK
jgi:hypothetical protein